MSRYQSPEGTLKTACLQVLKTSGKLYFRMQSGVLRKGSRFIHLCEDGTADILFFDGPQVCWAELKDPKGNTQKERRKKQVEFRERVLAMGHFHRYITSVDDMLRYLSGAPDLTTEEVLAKGKARLTETIGKEKR